MNPDQIVYMKLALARSQKKIRNYKIRKRQGIVTLFLNDGTKTSKSFGYILKYL